MLTYLNIVHFQEQIKFEKFWKVWKAHLIQLVGTRIREKLITIASFTVNFWADF